MANNIDLNVNVSTTDAESKLKRLQDEFDKLERLGQNNSSTDNKFENSNDFKKATENFQKAYDNLTNSMKQGISSIQEQLNKLDRQMEQMDKATSSKIDQSRQAAINALNTQKQQFEETIQLADKLKRKQEEYFSSISNKGQNTFSSNGGRGGDIPPLSSSIGGNSRIDDIINKLDSIDKSNQKNSSSINKERLEKISTGIDSLDRNLNRLNNIGDAINDPNYHSTEDKDPDYQNLYEKFERAEKINKENGIGGNGNGNGGNGFNLRDFAGKFSNSLFSGFLGMMVARRVINYANEGYELMDRDEDLAYRVAQKTGDYGNDFTKARKDIEAIGHESGHTASETTRTILTYENIGGVKDTKTSMQDVEAMQKFARAYAIDPNELAKVSGTMNRIGATNEGDQQRFADMLAESIKVQGMSGREAELIQSTNDLAKSVASRTLTVDNNGLTNIMALQNSMSQLSPQLKGSQGASELQNMNNSIQNADNTMQILLGRGTKYVGPSGMWELRKKIAKGVSDPDNIATAIQNSERFINPLGLQGSKTAINLQKNILASEFHLKPDTIEAIFKDQETYDRWKKGGITEEEKENLKNSNGDLDEKFDEYDSSGVSRRNKYKTDKENTQKGVGDMEDGILAPLQDLYDNMPFPGRLAMDAIGGISGIGFYKLLSSKTFRKGITSLFGKGSSAAKGAEGVAKGAEGVTEGAEGVAEGVKGVAEGVKGAAKGASKEASWISKILPKVGKAGKVLGKVAPFATGIFEAYDAYSESREKGESSGEALSKGAGAGVGGGLGAWGGAEAGAAIGTAIFPGVGTLIGALGGTLLGGLAGSKLGGGLAGDIYEIFNGGHKSKEKQNEDEVTGNNSEEYKDKTSSGDNVILSQISTKVDDIKSILSSDNYSLATSPSESISKEDTEEVNKNPLAMRLYQTEEEREEFKKNLEKDSEEYNSSLSKEDKELLERAYKGEFVGILPLSNKKLFNSKEDTKEVNKNPFAMRLYQTEEEREEFRKWQEEGQKKYDALPEEEKEKLKKELEFKAKFRGIAPLSNDKVFNSSEDTEELESTSDNENIVTQREKQQKNWKDILKDESDIVRRREAINQNIIGSNLNAENNTKLDEVKALLDMHFGSTGSKNTDETALMDKLMRWLGDNGSSDSSDSGGTSISGTGTTNDSVFKTSPEIKALATGTGKISDAVNKYRGKVTEEAKKNGIENQVDTIMAMIMQESGGQPDALATDPMQSSEGQNLPPGAIKDPNKSIECGVKEYAQRLKDAGGNVALAIQSYNYGPGFIDYVRKNGSEFTMDQVQKYHDIMTAKEGYSYGTVKHLEYVGRYLPKGSYAIGSESIPEDQVAYVHKGEKIIPANENPDNPANVSSLTERNRVVTPVINNLGNNTLTLNVVVSGEIKGMSSENQNKITSSITSSIYQNSGRLIDALQNGFSREVH